MLTIQQLMQLSDEDIIRYIIELSGYNDIIHVINQEM